MTTKAAPATFLNLSGNARLQERPAVPTVDFDGLDGGDFRSVRLPSASTEVGLDVHSVWHVVHDC